LTYSTIQSAIRDFLGENTKNVDEAIAEGYRMALVPPPLGKDAGGHKWSFLEPLTTLTVWPSVAVAAAVTVTGVHAAGPPSLTTLTCTGGTPFYPSMVGKGIVITTIGTFTITAYTSSIAVVVSGDAECIAKTFSIAADGIYALPDDFADMASPFYRAAGAGYCQIRRAPEGYLRSLYEQTAPTGAPQASAIVPRAYNAAYDPATGCRWDALIWPIPGAVYVLAYKYRLLPNVLSSSNTLPVGGMEFGMLVQAAAVAAAEKMWRGGAGPMMQDFLMKLAAEVARDATRGPANLGVNDDASDDFPCPACRGPSGAFTYVGHV
jgi:hypothetical protein